MEFTEGDFVRVKPLPGCPGEPGRPHVPEEDGRYGEVRSTRLVQPPYHDHPIAVLYRTRTGGRASGTHTGLVRRYRADELEAAIPVETDDVS